MHDMAAGFAHEIRNPLASMEVVGGLLRRRLEGQPEALGLLAELLEAALATALTRIPFAGRIERDYDAAAPAICGNADQLRSALTELVVNALEAMSGRTGEIRLGLTVRGPARGAALGPEDEPAREVALCVSDSGPGVDPELREKLFYPFFTTKPRGSGLGLASAQKIAAAHGGAIEVDAQPGACTFRLRLPLAEEGAG